MLRKNASNLQKGMPLHGKGMVIIVKKVITMLLALMMVLGLAACGEKKPSVNSHNSPEEEGEDYTIATLAEAMKIGWNLGNTLDAPGGETAWGQPVTTPEMIDKIHELGFNTLRVPTSWGQHTSGAPDYVIDAEWMDRVEEIVNYALDNDMFVILNSHHDNDFYRPTKDNEESAVDYINKIWAQIAERFKNYDQHLIFQAMNEPRLTGTNYEWWIDYNKAECLEAIEVVNSCNQAFVDTVRAAGGKNSKRFLMASSYCGSPDFVLKDPFKLPTDTVEGKLLLSIHAYRPYNIAMGTDIAYRTFDDAGRRELDDLMQKQYDAFVSKGVGVVIDEMGIINKNNPYDRKDWGAYFVAKAKSLGIVCCWWDNQGFNIGEESYGLFDRSNLEVYETSIPPYEGMMAGLETPVDELKSFKPE